MLSNLANYLYRGQAQGQEESTASNSDITLRAIDTDDDWVLVERSEESNERQEKSPTGGVSSSENNDKTQASLPNPSSIVRDCVVVSRSSSCSSLPRLSFEESWFVTPPPCFTSEGPVNMETSPLENLLIEHPSMSVYQHRSCSQRRSSTGSSPISASSDSSSDKEDESLIEVSPVEGNREDAHVQDEVANRSHIVPPHRSARSMLSRSTLSYSEERQFHIKAAQKVELRRAYRNLRRNVLDRSNKAREVNSRNRHPRRSERMHRHSGANNNRKC